MKMCPEGDGGHPPRVNTRRADRQYTAALRAGSPWLAGIGQGQPGTASDAPVQCVHDARCRAKLTPVRYDRENLTCPDW